MSPTTPAMSSGSSGFPRVSGDEPPTEAFSGPPRCFPRVSGDEPLGDAGLLQVASFSPRERG